MHLGSFDPLDVTTYYNNKCCIDDGELLAEAILMRFYAAVVEHEVGHTVGLRHNFSASTDVFNFFDPYYDIRELEPVPCVDHSECDQALGQFCKDGYCHQKKATTCSRKEDVVISKTTAMLTITTPLTASAASVSSWCAVVCKASVQMV